ncbi:hypothetical protein DL98DRAFT_529193 [Cadophora sp. DSE1049]|nr:hypothetical protein DL98DRAFT_529193 [Cadophora sp. DSE1049]
MPPLPPFTPFPSPFRVGTDICSIPRILALLKGNYGNKFVMKVLRPEEREQFEVGRVVRRWGEIRGRLELGRRRKEEWRAESMAVRRVIGKWKGEGCRRVVLEGRDGWKGDGKEEGIEIVGRVERLGKDDLQREVLSVVNKKRQESKELKLMKTTGDENRKVVEESDGNNSWASKFRGMFGGNKGPDMESGEGEKDSEKGTSTEVRASVEGNKTESVKPKTMSDAARRMGEEKYKKENQLLLAEIESRRAWMTSRGYDYQDTQKAILGRWDRTRRLELEKKQRKEEGKTVSPEKKEEWFLEKKAQRTEKRRIQAKVMRFVMSGKLPLPSGDGGGVDGFWQQMKAGVMDGQGMMDGVWVTGQQSSSEEDNRPELHTKQSETKPTPSDDVTTTASEPLPVPRAEHNESEAGQRLESDKTAVEQKTSTPSIPPTTENTTEPAESTTTTPTTPPSDSSNLDRLAVMFTELIKQNREDLALAKQKQKARITYIPTSAKKHMERQRLDGILSKKTANLTTIMKEMGIEVSPEEAAILAGEARLLGLEEEGDKYKGWRSVPISGRQEVGREVRREEVPQVEKGPQIDESVVSSVVGQEKPPEETDETESAEQSLEDLEKEMRDADAEMLKAARFLAGRFAAKEATMKAHLSRRLTYHSILILKPERKPGETGSLAPVAVVLPEGETGQGKEVRISISHDGDFASAVCLAVDE